MRVFVLLFNANTDNEGIYTIKITSPERGERNVVLMFESEDDATRFGLMLEAQDFPPVSVEPIDSKEIEEFCESADYSYELIEEGSLAIPLENTVEKTDWQPEDSTEPAEANKPEFAESELDQIRRRLERLM